MSSSYDLALHSILEASRHAHNSKQHPEAIVSLKQAIGFAAAHATQLEQTDPKAAESFRGEFKPHLDRIVTLLERQGTKVDLKKSDQCNHQMLKRNQACDRCGLLQKNLGILADLSADLIKSYHSFVEPLEKSKNVRARKEEVFGQWKTTPKSPERAKQIASLTTLTNKRYNLEVQQAPGKLNHQGKMINKPDLTSGKVEHIGNPDSLAHELGHLEVAPKNESLTDYQINMDAKWGKQNVEFGYKQQARLQPEYEATALENPIRRRAGLPAHKKHVSNQTWEKKRAFAADQPGKVIVKEIENKKGGKVRLTGTSDNRSAEANARVDQIDRGELVYNKDKGWHAGTGIDSKINQKARLKSFNPNRKDHKTLMRSKQELLDLLKSKMVELRSKADLMKAKILDFKSGKVLATLPGQQTAPRGEKHQGSIQPKPKEAEYDEDGVQVNEPTISGPMAGAAKGVMGRMESAKPAKQSKKMFQDKGPNAVTTPSAKAKARAMRNTRTISTPRGEHKRYFKFQNENGTIAGKKGEKVRGYPMAPGHRMFGIPAKEPGVHGHTSRGDKAEANTNDAKLRGRSAAGINAEYGTKRARETGKDDFGSLDRAKEMHTKKLLELRAMPAPKLTKGQSLNDLAKAKILDFKSGKVLADLPTETTPKVATGFEYTRGDQEVVGIKPGVEGWNRLKDLNQKPKRKSAKSLGIEKEHVAGINKRAEELGVEIFHASTPDHRNKQGIHVLTPSAQELHNALDDAEKDSFSRIVIHHSPETFAPKPSKSDNK
jgi:hypothetical protein